MKRTIPRVFLLAMPLILSAFALAEERKADAQPPATLTATPAPENGAPRTPLLTAADDAPMMCPLQEVRVARCAPAAANPSPQQQDLFPVKQVLVCQTEKKEFLLSAKVVVNGELRKMGPIPAIPKKNPQTSRVEFATPAGTILALSADRSTAEIRQCTTVIDPTAPSGSPMHVLCEARPASCP